MSLSALQRLLISQSARIEWYRSMAATVDAGKPVFETLTAMRRDFAMSPGDQPMVPLLDELIRRLRGGERPNAPLRRNLGSELEGLVPSTERMLIEAGVSADRTAEGFRNAADFLQELRELRQSVARGLTIPGIYMVLGVAIMIFFGRRIFPSFESVTPRKNWPADAQFMASVGDNAGVVVAGLLALAGLVAYFLLRVAPRWVGRSRVWVDRHLFPFNLMAAVSGAKFLIALKGYIRAGIPFADAIQDIGTQSNPYMRWQCRRIMQMLRQGRSMDEAVVSVSIVPRRYHWLVAVYGGAGDPTTSYVRIANEIMSRVKSLITNLFERTISALMLALVGGMILWMYNTMLNLVDPFSSTFK